MSKNFNVFISWSGVRSLAAAQALREWLPKVVQASKPWMSEADIDKGSRGLAEITNALEGIKVGIVCLTPENLTAPWILYESGALSKTVDDKTRLCTYLLAGLQPQDVKPPLGMFQATKADKENTRRLVYSVNKAVSEDPVPENLLDDVFNAMWSQLEIKLTNLPNPTEVVEAKRSQEDMVAEILEIVRADANRRKKTDRLDEFIPLLEEVLPFLRDEVTRFTTRRPGASVSEKSFTGPLEPPPSMRSIYKLPENH